MKGILGEASKPKGRVGEGVKQLFIASSPKSQI
jgi:hypothetical protein